MGLFTKPIFNWNPLKYVLRPEPTHRSKLKKYMYIAEDLDIEDLLLLRPELLSILAYICRFAADNDAKVVVTSLVRTPEKDLMLGAKSKTHQTGRAFDISMRLDLGWTIEKIDRLESEIESNFSDVGALQTSGASRPIVVHKNATNNGRHAHIQVRW